MDRSKQTQKGASPSAGLSMVLVVVMLMVFFILGAAVLTAASATTAAASRRTAERQAYYYARSALDVLDKSLQAGALGESLKTDALDRLGSASQAAWEITESTPLELTVELTGTDSAGGVTFPSATLSYAGKATVQEKTENGNPSRIAVQLQNLLLTVRATYQEQPYTMRVQYRYAGWATLSDGTWNWSEGGWTIQQIG